jgi:hypothetical protein
VFGVIALTGLLAWLWRERPPAGAGGAVVLEFEIRTPPGAATLAGDSQALYAYLTASKASMQPVVLAQSLLRQEQGRWLLPGSAPLHTRRPGLYLALGGARLNQATIYFFLTGDLWATPGAWSGWMTGSPGGDLSPASDGAAFELRVRRQAAVSAAA